MKKLLLLALFLASFNLYSWAQDSNDALLKKLVEKNVLTQDEADALKAESNKEESKSGNVIDKNTEKVRDIFSSIPYVRIGGYGMMMYQYKQYKPSHHNFDLRVVYLSVGGKITNNLSYFFLSELVNPMIYEYYIDWKPIKEFNIRGGEFKVPFTIENTVALFNLETVFNTRSVSALAGMGDDVLTLNNGVNKTGRDIGIQFSGSLISKGDHDWLQYAVGMFQGEGMNVSEKNNNKDFAGSLYVQPIKGLRVGGGAYFGESSYTKVNENKFRSHVRNRWAVSAEYMSDDLTLRSEWIRGNDGGIEKEGLHGMGLWYFLPKRMNAVAKVDYYNQNKNTGSEVMDYTIGLNYYFYNQCRVTLNYTLSDYSNKWRSSRNTENAVVGQVQIVF